MYVLYSFSINEDRCKYGFKLCYKIFDFELSIEFLCMDESNFIFYYFLNFIFFRILILIYIILYLI